MAVCEKILNLLHVVFFNYSLYEITPLHFIVKLTTAGFEDFSYYPLNIMQSTDRFNHFQYHNANVPEPYMGLSQYDQWD